MGQLGGIYKEAFIEAFAPELKKNLKIVCVSLCAVKYLLKDLKTLPQEHRPGQILSVIILQSI